MANAGSGLLTTAIPRIPQNISAAGVYPPQEPGALSGQPALANYTSFGQTPPSYVDMNQSVPSAFPYQTSAAPVVNAPVKQVHFNGGSEIAPPMPSVRRSDWRVYSLRAWFQWKAQQSMQYYTFHPKALYKERGGAEDKPSVLEMENNYLLKHHQRQSDPEFRLSSMGSLTRGAHAGFDQMGTLPRSAATISGGRRLPRSGAPPRLTRVRSEELLGTRSEPDLRPPIDLEENCSWFVALFDYDHHMSPNPNAQDEELSFRKHQLIKVIVRRGGTCGTTIWYITSSGVRQRRSGRLLPRPDWTTLRSSTLEYGHRDR